MSLVKDDFKEIDRELVSKSEMEAKLQVYLSGMVCVEDIFKEKYSNVADDIKKAKKIAHRMIEEYGMGNKLIPTQAEIEDVLNDALSKTKILYLSQKEIILKVQSELLEKEVITKERVKELFDEVL